MNKKDLEPLSPDEGFNGNLTAKPKNMSMTGQAPVNEEDISEAMDYGEMNLEDAKDSGYTDQNEKAVSLAKRDVEGSPTGAYTDIGAGRSSVVHHHSEVDKKSDPHH